MLLIHGAVAMAGLPYVLQDRIWVAAGHAKPLSSEVWSLEVPKDWFKDK